MKIKIRTYVNKVYTNLRSLNVPEDDIECEFFGDISIDSLLVHKNKYYVQVSIFRQLCLQNCKQANDRLSWLQSFQRLDINAVLR